MKKRSGMNNSGHAENGTLRMSNVLHSMSLKVYHEESVKAAEKRKLNSKTGKERRIDALRKATIKIPDEAILKMRTLHEVDRLPLKAVQAMFPEIQDNYLRKVLNYEIRSNLVLK